LNLFEKIYTDLINAWTYLATCSGVS
jgi:hypothetical protein